MSGDAPRIIRRRFAASDGASLSFLDSQTLQAGAGRQVIAMVPGWSMPAALWCRTLETLGTDFHCVALDPRGQGESDIPAAGYTAERRAKDILEFLAPFSRVLLVGWSLGAIESLQYIHLFGAEKLAGLVLVDSSVGEDPAPAGSDDFIARLRAGREAVLRDFCSAIFAAPRPQEEIDDLARSAARMSLEDSLALLHYPFERSHWKHIVHELDKPLLYAVTGQFAEQAGNLLRHRPATQVEIFEGAGHALFVDEPERFNRLVREFAARAFTAARGG